MVSLAGARDKLDTTIPLNIDVIAKTPTEPNATTIEIRFTLDDIALDQFTVPSVDTVTSTADLVTTGGGFANVRVGDDVSGTGIPVGAYILTKTDDNNLIMDQNATATGTITATFNSAKTVDATVYTLQVEHAINGQTMTAKTTYYQFDGTAVADADSDDDDEVTVSSASKTVNFSTQSIDLNAFLTNARQAQTN